MANVLMKSFKCRKKKVPPQCILTFHEALKQYGLGCIKPVIPDLLKSIRPMFEVSDKKVRDAVQDLVVEICRFTGPALFETLLSKLRSAQKKSLEERFEKISRNPFRSLRLLLLLLLLLSKSRLHRRRRQQQQHQRMCLWIRGTCFPIPNSSHLYPRTFTRT